MNGPLRDRPLVFVGDLLHPVLSGVDERHLRRALRLTVGAPLTIGDGAGRHRPGRLASDGVEPEGPIVSEPEPATELTVCFTPVKGEKSEWMVAKLTELGIDRIVPIRAARSVVKWDEERAAKLAARFAVTAREACMQSRRTRLPVVEPALSFNSLRTRQPVVAEPGGRPMTADDTVVAIGPEGGWDPEEIDDLDQVALPGTILRAETAVVAAAALMVSFRSGLVESIGSAGSPSTAP